MHMAFIYAAWLAVSDFMVDMFHAENIAKYIEKGSLVAVQGNLRIDRYTDKQGNKRTYTKVWGNSIQFLNNKLDNKSEQNNSFVPSFDTSDFQAVEDDDVPF